MKGTVQVLLQKPPVHLNLTELHSELQEVAGVEEVHELHVWQLNLSKVVGSFHVILAEGTDFMKVFFFFLVFLPPLFFFLK